jgi:hypothetical protein
VFIADTFSSHSLVRANIVESASQLQNSMFVCLFVRAVVCRKVQSKVGRWVTSGVSLSPSRDLSEDAGVK